VPGPSKQFLPQKVMTQLIYASRKCSVFLNLPLIKGIFQPFELGGVTRLIRSAVKFWKAGNIKKKFLMIQIYKLTRGA
jgi:hypothetical protein